MSRKKIAVTGWATESGVGRELCDAVAHLPILGTFLFTHVTKRNRFDLIPEAVRYISGGRDPMGEMEAFIERFHPDVMLTWEWPANWGFPALWRKRGIRWVNVVHWDWFPLQQMEILKQADLVAPNELCQEGLRSLGLSGTILPVPVDLERFTFSERREASRFGMAYGAGGPHGRRSLVETLEAWEGLPDAPELVIRSQNRCPEYRKVQRTRLVVGSLPDPAAVYADFDVAVQPSKFEGVGLSLLEAQACGAPVVTVDAEPMKTLAPDLLVAAIPSEVSTMNGNCVTAWTPSVSDLRRVVSELRGQKDISMLSKKARLNAEQYSWEHLRGRWEGFLLR